jgi:hypothetical protein
MLIIFMNIATLATTEEIQTRVKYPVRRIKPILYTMESSGIRLGACNLLKYEHVSLIHMIRILILDRYRHASLCAWTIHLLYCYNAIIWYAFSK